jgi:hypothetical protein
MPSSSPAAVLRLCRSSRRLECCQQAFSSSCTMTNWCAAGASQQPGLQHTTLHQQLPPHVQQVASCCQTLSALCSDGLERSCSEHELATKC